MPTNSVTLGEKKQIPDRITSKTRVSSFVIQDRKRNVLLRYNIKSNIH